MCSEPTTSGEKHNFEVAHVTWVDIEDRSSSAWIPWDQALEDAREPFKPILSVGIVLYEDDSKLSIASSVGPEETSGALSIPKPLIRSDVRYMVGLEAAVPPQDSILGEHGGEEKAEISGG